MNKTRVEAVSDGIFAIAITLLVLTISEPDDYSHLASQLGHRWPSLAAYVVSFAIIGIMWFNHHSVFGYLERIDGGLFYLNLLLLMTVAFLPYPTGVLGKALLAGHGARTAAIVYSVTMAINALAWGALWIYASSNRRLLTSSFPEAPTSHCHAGIHTRRRRLRSVDRCGVHQRLRLPRVPRRAGAVLRIRPDLAASQSAVGSVSNLTNGEPQMPAATPSIRHRRR